jgi:superfamily II DNA or RNA helicase
MSKEAHLMWDDSVLTIAPSSAALEKFLTYREKSLIQDPKNPWKKVTKVTVNPLYKVVSQQNGYNVIQTMQGMWLKVKTFLEEQGWDVKFYDMRVTFPKPRLDLMCGFRFRQEELLKSFLNTNCSGLLGAPTRYGKTTLIKNTLRAFPNVHTVVTAPGADLVKQLHDDIKEALPHREVKLIGAGSTKSPCDDINVASMDSLHKCDASACKLLLIDEPHACVTDSRLPELTKFDKARKIGFGATLKGRFDQRDILIEALIGPVIAERTFQEAVAEGAVCPLIVYMIVIPLSGNSDDRDLAYKTHLFKGERVAKAVRWICHELLPSDWQTLIFIKNEDQAEYFLDWVGQAGTIAMAKRMTKKEREALMERMRGDEIKRCLASEIYAQGVTFNHVRSLINLSGGGANTSTIQKPGRLAEVRPDKKCGVVFDFFFTPGTGRGSGTQALCRESMARVNAYTEKGYEIIYVDSYNALEQSFKEKAL